MHVLDLINIPGGSVSVSRPIPPRGLFPPGGLVWKESILGEILSLERVGLLGTQELDLHRRCPCPITPHLGQLQVHSGSPRLNASFVFMRGLLPHQCIHLSCRLLWSFMVWCLLRINKRYSPTLEGSPPTSMFTLKWWTHVAHHVSAQCSCYATTRYLHA